MLIFIGYHHLLYDLLNILIGRFDSAIHFRSVRGRIMMLDFERLTKLLHHLVVQIRPIISDDLFRHSIVTDNIVLNKPSYHLLGDIGIGCSFDPFCKNNRWQPE